MSASINRRDTHWMESHVTITKHAKERMATRGLRADAIEAVLAYGRVVYVRGADVYAIGRKEIARYAEEGIDLSPYDGVQVVVSCEGAILTAYRNRSFNGLRNRHTYRRKTSALAA